MPLAPNPKVPIGKKKSLVFCQFSSLHMKISKMEGKGHEPSGAELKILQLGSGSSLLLTLIWKNVLCSYIFLTNIFFNRNIFQQIYFSTEIFFNKYIFQREIKEKQIGRICKMKTYTYSYQTILLWHLTWKLRNLKKP